MWWWLYSVDVGEASVTSYLSSQTSHTQCCLLFCRGGWLWTSPGACPRWKKNDVFNSEITHLLLMVKTMIQWNQWVWTQSSHCIRSLIVICWIRLRPNKNNQHRHVVKMLTLNSGTSGMKHPTWSRIQRNYGTSGVSYDSPKNPEPQLTGTFFCVTTTAQSFPLTATDVSPPWLMALNAYSVNKDKWMGFIEKGVGHHVSTPIRLYQWMTHRGIITYSNVL